MQLGQITTTRGIYEAMQADAGFNEEIRKAFYRYECGEWGDLDEEDKQANREALQIGARVLARYNTSRGGVYIITEADRSLTTILFCSEY